MRQRADRARSRRAVAGAVALIGGLTPGRATVGREVDAGIADALGEGAVRGSARGVVDLVVRASGHDAGIDRVDRETGLVLLVLWERARIAAGVDERLARLSARGKHECRRRYHRRHEPEPTHNPTPLEKRSLHACQISI